MTDGTVNSVMSPPTETNSTAQTYGKELFFLDPALKVDFNLACFSIKLYTHHQGLELSIL